MITLTKYFQFMKLLKKFPNLLGPEKKCIMFCSLWLSILEQKMAQKNKYYSMLTSD